jgi:uncharacterized membrane protein YjjP (DUF1212 family)
MTTRRQGRATLPGSGSHGSIGDRRGRLGRRGEMCNLSEALGVDHAEPVTSRDSSDAGRTLKVAMRVAVAMLASGGSTGDVEATVREVARAYDARGVQAAVTFSTISVSQYTGDGPPVTLLHLVRDRTTDFGRLAGVSAIVRRITARSLGLDAAERELGRLEEAVPAYRPWVRFAAPGLSAAGSTLMLGGNELDAAATLAIGLTVQPLLSMLDRSTIPPFFRLATGVAGTTLLVALLVGLGASVNGGLVLTGGLLRFLPGYALVAGFRDLIEGSMVSGTARLAESLLLAAAVAGGASLALLVAARAGVVLSLASAGWTAWGPWAMLAASALAVGAFAVRLGVPHREAVQAAGVGVLAWAAFSGITAGQIVDASAATFAATVLIGTLGRLLARRYRAPAALWVVPAVLPFLPGLQLVQAMLAETDQAQLSGLVAAAGTAFVIGTGVALGDVLVQVVRGVRDQVVRPVVGAVADGVEVLVVGPVGRAVEQVRAGQPAAPGPDTELSVTRDRADVDAGQDVG